MLATASSTDPTRHALVGDGEEDSEDEWDEFDDGLDDEVCSDYYEGGDE